jgi:hypothetical protein
MDKSTPRPWEADQPDNDADYPDRGAAFITARGCGLVGAALPLPTELESGDFSRVQANARLIVEAVNSLSAHRACVEALADLVPAIKKHINASGGADGYLLARLSDAERALAALEALKYGS